MNDKFLPIRIVVAIIFGLLSFPIIALAASGIGLITMISIAIIVEGGFMYLGNRPDAKDQLEDGLIMLSAPFWLPVITWYEWARSGEFPK